MQSLPVNYLARYVSKYILNNDLLFNLMNLKLKRLLTLINSPLVSEIKIDIDTLKVSEA